MRHQEIISRIFRLQLAYGCTPHSCESRELYERLLVEELSETGQAWIANDIIGTIDGLCDVATVSVGYHLADGEIVRGLPLSDCTSQWRFEGPILGLIERATSSDMVNLCVAFATKELAQGRGLSIPEAAACYLDCLEEVTRSNESKLADGLKDERGKIKKGPSYSPPNIAGTLAKHGVTL